MPPTGSRCAARVCAAAALVLPAVCGCGRRDPDTLVFAVGGAPSELAVWEEFVADFEASAGIPVEILRRPADTAQQRQSLITALDAGQRNPDVFLMDVAWIGLFAEAGWLEPLTGIDRSPFFASVIESVDLRGGELIALPVYVDGGLLYYRTDLLERHDVDGPPATQAELRDTAAHIQAAERAGDPRFHGFVWQGAQYEGLICNFLEFAGSEGGFRRRGGRLVVDVPANRRAVEFMHDLIWKSSVSPPSTYTEMREEEARAWFQAGDALYERNWPYAWALHQRPDSPVRGDVGVAPVPAPRGAESVSTLGGWHVAVSRHSDRKDAARRFVEFVTSAETQKAMVRRLGWNPGRADLYDDPEVLEHAPHFRELAAVFRRARPRPVVPYYTQVSRVLQRHLSAVLADRTDAASALRRAQSEIDALAARYAPTPRGDERVP